MTKVILDFKPETPFGIHLYPYFEKVYNLVANRKASSFRFASSRTPLNTDREVIIACITYFVIIFGGEWIMKHRTAFKPQLLFQLHNALLTIVSAGLLALIAEQVLPQIYHHGFLYAICSSKNWTQPLELLYYLNYLVKYWELLDTVFLVLKKKKLEFLHYFHHSMTMVLCYSQLKGQTTVSWVPITLNLFVHVLMYYYYYQAAAGVRIWWKKYLTSLQIIQFVIDLCIVYFCTFTHYSHTYWPWVPDWGDCHGTEASALFGCGLLSSYLLLFISFYRSTYKKQKIREHDIQETQHSKQKKSKKL
ncbi:putative elongation of fatty acids protein 1 [Choanephora cucurbitarum]|uniref:Elongation of fatty acids protein n=1 Tax=Choanephora cucurbitarum TaxID=101091 RepID=A0A1C7NET2_9FUNG|nr:putative elongation of fatty acids protein 1 [Choanephora cucurbitarum]